MTFLNRLRGFIPIIMRRSTLDEIVDTKVNDAIIEYDAYDRVSEGNELIRHVKPGLGQESIFAHESLHTEGIKEASKIKDFKVANISEGAWASVGFTINQDPDNIQTVDRLRLAQKASVYQWANFPIAKSIIESLKRYILGRGLKIDCPIPDINKLIANFWTGNSMELRFKNIVREYFLKGEWFGVFFDQHDVLGEKFDPTIDPLLLLRTISSEEIDDIEYDPNDAESIWVYKRTRNLLDESNTKYYLDIGYPFGDESEHGISVYGNEAQSQKEGESEEHRMMFIKHGLLLDPRGRVFMDTVLRWNRVYVDFVYNRCQLNHIRTKIFLIESRTGASGKRVASGTSVERMPRGGMKLIETPDRQYKILAPNTGADDADTDVKMLLYLIASGVSMPLHILNMNAENENFASIKEAGTPFVQMVYDYQDEFGEHLKKMLRFLIKMGIRKGVIQQEYSVEYYPEDAIRETIEYVNKNLQAENYNQVLEQARGMLGEKETKVIKAIHVPLNIVFPNIAHSDPSKQSSALKIYKELGLMSRYTARIQLGLDPEVEEWRIDAEYEKDSAKAEEEFRRRNTGMGHEPEEEPEEEKKVKSESIFYDSAEEFGIMDDTFPDISEEELEILLGEKEGTVIEADDPTLKERQARYRANNNAKVVARRAVHKALASGKITIPKVCQAPGCTSTGPLWAHHADYRKPLQIRWLCKKHRIAADMKKQESG